MGNYSGYETISGEEDLWQGNIINLYPIIVPFGTIELGTVSAEVIEYDVVVMSQTCDLVQRKLDLVLVCPIWNLSEFKNRSDFFKSREGKEALRRGDAPGYHLLNECEIKGFETDYLVVDFRSVYSVPSDFIINLTERRGERLRLLPPYREHLSQSFARFFMRVGLPVDILPFNQ